MKKKLKRLAAVAVLITILTPMAAQAFVMFIPVVMALEFFAGNMVAFTSLQATFVVSQIYLFSQLATPTPPTIVLPPFKQQSTVPTPPKSNAPDRVSFRISSINAERIEGTLDGVREFTAYSPGSPMHGVTQKLPDTAPDCMADTPDGDAGPCVPWLFLQNQNDPCPRGFFKDGDICRFDKPYEYYSDGKCDFLYNYSTGKYGMRQDDIDCKGIAEAPGMVQSDGSILTRAKDENGRDMYVSVTPDKSKGTLEVIKTIQKTPTTVEEQKLILDKSDKVKEVNTNEYPGTIKTDSNGKPISNTTGGGGGASSSGGTGSSSSGSSSGGENDFCKFNPQSTACQTHNYGGASCGATPSCSGDAILCAIAIEQHKRNCELLSENDLSKVGDTAIAGGDVTGGKDPRIESNKSKTDISKAVNRDKIFTCNALEDKVFTVNVMSYSKEIKIPFSEWNPYLDIAGKIVVAFALIWAARIMFGGSL